MSKKKPTPPLPLTGVITITTDGRSTLAMRATHRGEDIEVSTGMANCRPGDVYSEYEGARIALARLYGVDPFPKVENAVKEKGHWEKATKENCKVGSRVRVCAPNPSGGRYRTGDLGVVVDVQEDALGPSFTHILFDGNNKPTWPGCFFRELEVWIPDATEDKPQEKGHWEPATQENCRVGSRVKVVSAKLTAGMYHDGQKGRVHSYSGDSGSTVYVVFDGNKYYTKPCCHLRELEVWVPDAPEEAKPQEAPIPEAPKPPAPSFRVGDIVRLREGKNVFAPKLKGKVGKVYEVWENPDLWITHYTIVLNDGSGAPTLQYCSEWSGHPAPLELVYREPEKGGEKA